MSDWWNEPDHGRCEVCGDSLEECARMNMAYEEEGQDWIDLRNTSPLVNGDFLIPFRDWIIINFFYDYE